VLTIKHILPLFIVSSARPGRAIKCQAQRQPEQTRYSPEAVSGEWMRCSGTSRVCPRWCPAMREAARLQRITKQVSSGDTGHAEAVRVRFDSAQVSYQQLLQVFFSVAHDPTQLKPPRPRNVGQPIPLGRFFITSAEQQQLAPTYIRQLAAARTYSRTVVTQVAPLQQFYPPRSITRNYLGAAPEISRISSSTTSQAGTVAAKRFPGLYR